MRRHLSKTPHLRLDLNRSRTREQERRDPRTTTRGHHHNSRPPPWIQRGERERAWRGDRESLERREREDAAGERDRRERDGARCKREEVLMARVFLFSGISAKVSFWNF